MELSCRRIIKGIFEFALGCGKRHGYCVSRWSISKQAGGPLEHRCRGRLWHSYFRDGNPGAVPMDSLDGGASLVFLESGPQTETHTSVPHCDSDSLVRICDSLPAHVPRNRYL